MPKTLLVLLTLFATQKVEAGRKWQICVAALTAASARHSVSSTSTEHTTKAFSQLRQFWQKELRPLRVGKSSREASGSHNSSARKKKAIARRAEALVHEFYEESREDNNSVIVGDLFVGAEEINRFLGEVENGLRETRSEFSRKEMTLNRWNIRLRLNLLGFGWTPVFAAVAYGAHKIGGFPLASLPIVFSLMGITRLMPAAIEENVRELLDWQPRPGKLITKIKETVDTLVLEGKRNPRHSAHWFYGSKDFRLYEELVSSTWSSGSPNMAGLQVHWLSAKEPTIPRVVLPADRPAFEGDRHLRLRDKRTWVRMDHLLYYDRERDQPVLAFFLRFTSEPRGYPEAQTIAENLGLIIPEAAATANLSQP